MVKFTGILAAVPTPLSADSSQVDVANIKKQVDRLVAAGIPGIVATGTTGEFTTLSEDEHKATIKAYIDAAAGRVPVVAGFGLLSAKKATAFAQWCESAGASACMVVPPFYDPLPFEAVKKFFTSVCASVNIPFMYYNLPGATGIKLNAEQIRELGSIKGLDYLKDTSGDAKEQVDVLTKALSNPTDKFSLFNGWDTLTFSAFALGATAGIVGGASIVPREFAEFYETLVVKGDLKAAREQWKFIWAICDFLESVNYPAGIKAGLEIIGSPAGPVREPNEPLSKEDYKRLEDILSQRKYK